MMMIPVTTLVERDQTDCLRDGRNLSGDARHMRIPPVLPIDDGFVGWRNNTTGHEVDSSVDCQSSKLDYEKRQCNGNVKLMRLKFDLGCSVSEFSSAGGLFTRKQNRGTLLFITARDQRMHKQCAIASYSNKSERNFMREIGTVVFLSK